MSIAKQLSIFLVVSLVISIVVFSIELGASVLSLDGIISILLQTLSMVAIPVGLCSIPTAIHWLIWKEWLNGIEISVWALWLMSCLTSILFGVG